jgi:hypothetical protein
LAGSENGTITYNYRFQEAGAPFERWRWSKAPSPLLLFLKTVLITAIKNQKNAGKESIIKDDI